MARSLRRILISCLCIAGLSACNLLRPIPPPAPAPVVAPQVNTQPILLTPAAAPTLTSFSGPLSVIIHRPQEYETLNASPVEISGEADPGTVITLNAEVVLVDDSRSFAVQLPLENGTNLIEITASDLQGNQDFSYLSVFYEP